MLNIPKEALTVKNRGVQHGQLSTSIFYVKKVKTSRLYFLSTTQLKRRERPYVHRISGIQPQKEAAERQIYQVQLIPELLFRAYLK